MAINSKAFEAINNTAIVKTPFKLCNSIRLGVEVFEDKISITQVGEKLDFELLLQRAQMGVVDLQAYQRSRNCDLHDLNVSEETINDLLDRPASVLDNTFGFAREDGEQEVLRNREVADNYKKPYVTPKVPKEEPPKDEPPKDPPIE